MAWYSTGTLTATNGSDSITGAGTLFMPNVRVGDGVTISGSTSLYQVVNVTSDTQLTISPAYAGSTGSGKPYGIVPVQGYVRDLADQAKALILSSGTLTPTSSNIDTTPGRLIKVGDYGENGGTPLYRLATDDASLFNVGGTYIFPNGGLNLPTNGAYFVKHITYPAVGYAKQFAWGITTKAMFTRTQVANTWQDWTSTNPDAVANLISTSAVLPLAANQGKALKDAADTLSTTVGTLNTTVGTVSSTVTSQGTRITALEAIPRPIQYAFHVYATPQVVVGNAVTYVPKSAPTLNEGAGYDPATGRFWAQKAGLYRFSLTVSRGAEANASPQIGIKLNGTGVYSSALAYSAAYSSTTAPLLIKLAVGDFIEPYILGTNAVSVTVYSFIFEGHIL